MKTTTEQSSRKFNLRGLFTMICTALITWVSPRMFPLCKSNVRNFLTMLFLLSGMMFITQKSDAQCNSFQIDFKQGANRDNFGGYTTGELHWINSILQQSNSRYAEGMSTMQRVIFDNLPSCGGNHILRIKLEARKGDVHAYDFITSWDNALKAAAAIAPGFGLMPANRADPKLHQCDEAISSCTEDVCNLVTNGGGGTGAGAIFRDLPIIFSSFNFPDGPGEANLLIDDGTAVDQNTTRQVIETYECRYGDNITIPDGLTYAGEYDRSVRVYVEGGTFSGANGDANNAVLFVGYGDANPNDGGDTYIYYDIMWSSTSSSVVLEFAAHISVGVDGLAASNPNNCNASGLGVGYLLNRGASSISGGPYHVIIEDFQDAPGNTPNCEPNLGNQDNQLQGTEVFLIPECELDGPSAICGNATATYTAIITNPDNATNANNSTFLWEIINSSQSPPAASIIGAASGNVPQVPAGETTVPLSITVNPGGAGSYTVKLTITNGAATNTTEDDISSSCTVSTTVTGGPAIDCPDNITVNPCQTQAQINTAYQNWLLTVTPSGATHNGGSVGPDKCGGTKTVIFTATNTCGSTTCSATFTVTADVTPPAFTGSYADVDLGCNPGDPTGSLGTATATDNCGATTITSVDGAITSDGCNRSQTRTFTARDGCNNTSTTSRTVRWISDLTPPVITTGGGSLTLGCNPSASDINAALGTATASDNTNCVQVGGTGGGALPPGSCIRDYKGNNGGGNCPFNGILPPTGKVTLFFTSVLTAAPTILSVTDNVPGTDLSTIVFGPGVLSSDGLSAQYCYYNGPNNNNNLWGSGIILTFNLQFANGQGCSGNPAPAPTPTPGTLAPTVSDGPVISTGCSRSQTRTFTASDACGNTATASRTATWTADNTGPIITTGGTTTTLGCNPSAGDINAALGTATAADACSTATVTSSDGSVSSDNCSRSQTRTWTARDACGNTSTAARTVTWIADNTAPVFTSTPASVDLECLAAIPAVVTPTASDACGTPTVTMTGSTDNPANCATGFKRIVTRTWTATDACGNTATYTQTIRVKCCETVCTLTQGAYGNAGGNICLPNGTTVNQTQIMIAALTAAPGNMAVFGRQDLNRYWVIRLSDVNQGNNSNIFNMLPGGGPSTAFGEDNVAGVPEYDNAPSWPIAPLQPSGPQAGRIRNQLFSQTLTLYFNTTIAGSTLANVALDGSWAVLAPRNCGSSDPAGAGTPTELVSPVISSYLATHGYATTVAGLLQLANDALGGVNVSPLTLTQIQEAVANINEVFDECRILTGYMPAGGGGGRVITSNSTSSQPSLIVTAFPNPYVENFSLRINSPVSGQAMISFYTMDGVKIGELKRDVVERTDVLVPYNVPAVYRTRIVYTVSVGGYHARGLVLSPN